MTECNGCGSCCDPFVMVYSPSTIQLMRNRLDPDEFDFYAAHLRPISRREGRRRTGHWLGSMSEFVDSASGDISLAWAWYYECDRYDAETRRCTDYANRPDVCRGYPWYGQEPDDRKALPPECSYRADVGLPVAEVDVELRTGTDRERG